MSALKLLTSLLLLMILSGCLSKEEPNVLSKGALAEEESKQKEEIRKILNIHCGACHNSSLRTSKEGALRIFNINEEKWAKKHDRKAMEECLWTTQSKANNDS